jgi:hypothetical protein
MSDLAIAEELFKTNYRNACVVNVDLFYADCGLGQYKGYSTQKDKNVLLLSGVTFFHRKGFRIKDGY